MSRAPAEGEGHFVCSIGTIYIYILYIYIYIIIYTVWPEILAGNLFWRIGGFESNPPIFHPPKTSTLFVL